MFCGNEKLLGLPIYGDLPVHIPLAFLWVAVWAVWFAVVWLERRGVRPLWRMLLALALYEALGVLTCRVQFTAVPLKALHLALLITAAGTTLAAIAAFLILRRDTHALRGLLIAGIPALTIPVLLGVYAFAKTSEEAVARRAARTVSVVRSIILKYKTDTGAYPPSEGWQASLSPYVRGGLLNWSGCREIRYCKPLSEGGGQVLVYGITREGLILPARTIIVTLDGQVTTKSGVAGGCTTP